MSLPIEQKLACYIASRLPEASDVCVTDFARIAGGASRETFRFVLTYRMNSEKVSRKLILRRDMPSSLLESERRIEFAAYKAFFGTGIPVPEMLWLEEDLVHLDQPFFIAVELSGFEADPNLLQTEAFAPYREEVGRQMWSYLGQIARQDPVALGYGEFVTIPDPADVWRQQLDAWEGVLDDDSVRADPILRAMIRWMRRNPPPPPTKLAVVHGDYRTGNYLYDAQGNIHGILDWEMTHIGDPLEDLGWSLNKIWCYGKDERRGGLLARDKAIRIWEEASGLNADPAAIHWWELLATVKAQALWTSAAHNWINSEKPELIHAFTAWCAINSEDSIALELMERS